MMKRFVTFLGIVLSITLLTACGGEQPAEGPAAETGSSLPDTLAQHLLPHRVLIADAGKGFAVQERMDHLRVPGFSFALIEDGRLSAAGGFGFTTLDGTTKVNSETVYQAASMSKTVAAFAALILVERGLLDLDRPVNEYLVNWKIPDTEAGQANSITMRQLLSHTAALTVSGFPGYAPDEELPTHEQIFNGEEPANTEPIRINGNIGEIWRYSGGGYTVAEEVMETITGKPFAELMQEIVLDPLGMKHSSFQQPAPASYTDNAAVALNGRGEKVEDPWHIYPEQAAAGLWTTAEDYARFVLAIDAALKGEEGALISQELAREMITPIMNEYGLGVGVEGEGDSLQFGHGGSNYGYKCTFFYRPAPRFGLVLMSNADNGYTLFSEMRRGMRAEMQWGKYEQETIESLPLPEGYEAFAGDWYIAPLDFTFTIFVEDGALWAEDADTAPWQLHHVGDNRYRMLEENAVLIMQPVTEGQVDTIQLQFGDDIVPVTRIK